MSFENKVISILEDGEDFSSRISAISASNPQDIDGTLQRQQKLDSQLSNLQAWDRSLGRTPYDPIRIEAASVPYAQEAPIEDILIANMFYSSILPNIPGREERAGYIQECVV